MQIYVFRHGIAEDAEIGQSDSERRLTPKGITKLRKILVRAREAGVSPDEILTSPYLRAVETAEVAKEVLEFPEQLIETEALTPMNSPEAVWEEVRNHRAAEVLMLVGHNPLLSNLVCFLTGAPAYGIELKKGAIAYIDVPVPGPRPQGTLLWLLTARTAGA